MARKKKSTNSSVPRKGAFIDTIDDDLKEIPIVDQELSLYDLTSIFYESYCYHNGDKTHNFTQFELDFSGNAPEVKKNLVPMSRFEALRRIEAAYLGARVFPSDAGVDVGTANVPINYFKRTMRYVQLPFKSILSENKIVNIRVFKTLWNKTHLTPDEEIAEQVQNGGMGVSPENADLSDTVSDAYNSLLRVSSKFKDIPSRVAHRFTMDGLAAFIHSQSGWEPDFVQALDLITEPQASVHPDTWGSFFVIRKMTAIEAITHIQKKTPFWNGDALRWALEAAMSNRSLIQRQHVDSTGSTPDQEMMSRENFAIRSFYKDKAQRLTKFTAYYGSFYVVEGYYKNSKGKINKVIFFPSTTCLNITEKQALVKKDKIDKKRETDKYKPGIDGEDVLFTAENFAESMSDVISLVYMNREEEILERQRGYGHETLPLCEFIGRMDSAIAQTVDLMSNIYYNDESQGDDATNPEDEEVTSQSGMINLNGKVIAPSTPFKSDLGAMSSARSTYLAELAAMVFLGGLDNLEANSEGRGADLANLKLVRDGRIHKHDVRNFALGMDDTFSVSFRNVLDLINDGIEKSDPAVLNLFYNVVVLVYSYSKEVLKFKKDDVLPDTKLPYWMQLRTINNGAGSFGPAEIVILNEALNMFGSTLTQPQVQKISRMGMESLFGSEQALDILGDPRLDKVTDSDQLHNAQLETGSILGSVSIDSLDYVSIPARQGKDDHFIHLSQSHNPKMKEFQDALSQVEFSPAYLDQASPDELQSKNIMILKFAALAAHASQHLEMLSIFGKERDDVNKLREETNNYLQASEAMMNALQLSMRALIAKRQDERARLENISPENEAEKQKIALQLKQLAVQQAKDQNQQAILNRIQDDKRAEHNDKQLTAARDRASKERIAMFSAIVKGQESKNKFGSKNA